MTEPVEIRPLISKPPSFFCKIGWHSYEPQPGLLFHIRQSRWLFFTTLDQIGICRCQCCPARKYVHRHTIEMGILDGDDSVKWSWCSEEKAVEINGYSKY